MGKKNKRPEYVIICREFNRAAARIDITVIDKGVTDHLMDSLINFIYAIRTSVIF